MAHARNDDRDAMAARQRAPDRGGWPASGVINEADGASGDAEDADVAPAMRLQPGPVVADYVSGAALLSGPADSERDVRAIEDLLR